MRRLTAVAALFALLALTPSTLAGSGFTGTFSGKLAATSAQFKPLNGTWKLTFAAGGKYTIARDGVALIRGTAAFGSGSKITFGHESGPAACPAAQPGSYHYAVHGKLLSFTAVKDACAGRLTVLTHVAYKRS